MAYRRKIRIKAGFEFREESLPVCRTQVCFKEPEGLFEFVKLLQKIPPVAAISIQ